MVSSVGPLEVLILLALVGVVVLVVRMLRRQANQSQRPCPRCGKPVPNGVLDCSACGFDFRAIGSSSSP